MPWEINVVSLSTLTCAVHLALAIVSIIRIKYSALAPRIALLCVVMFLWTFSRLAFRLTGQSEWNYLVATFSPLTTPVALHFVLTFVGERRRYALALYFIYFILGSLSLVSILAFFDTRAKAFVESSEWAATHILFVIPPLTMAILLLVRHLKRRNSPEEKMRTRLGLAALVIGTVFSSTELWAAMGLPIVRLGEVSSLAVTGLLTTIAFRYRLFESELTSLNVLYALAIAAVAVLGYLALFQYFMTSTAILILATLMLAFILFGVTRHTVIEIVENFARIERLALLGRLSAQMAHDLKNPLSSLKGAIQYLKEEKKRGHSIDNQEEFLSILEDEINRLSRMVDKYSRLGKLEPVLSITQINDLIHRLVKREQFHSSENVVLTTDLDKNLKSANVDPDLVSIAIDNIIRNAFEAMPKGGELRICTENSDDSRDPTFVIITISDTGKGMNARQMERALDEFYSSKAEGSGLGLSFAQRVARVHGGQIELSSQEGGGTQVRLYLSIT